MCSNVNVCDINVDKCKPGTKTIFLKIFSLKFCSCFKTNSCKKECLKTNQKSPNGFHLFIASLTTATPLKYILCLNWGCMPGIRGSVANQVVFSWVNIHRIENGRSMYSVHLNMHSRQYMRYFNLLIFALWGLPEYFKVIQNLILERVFKSYKRQACIE